MRDYRKLTVWQKSHELTLAIYKATIKFPKEEVYGLTSQARRAAVSVPANIAEGCGRQTEKELARFFQIAVGSASEVEYYALLAKDLKYISDKESDSLMNDVEEIKRMLFSFMKKLKAEE